MLRNLSSFRLPDLEENVLAFWKREQVFEQSLKRRARRKRFVFYEGPPTANGRPGIHHVLARAFKDVIPRFKTMRGFFVPRRAGWDTHGLPVEISVEKKLNLRSKKEIEQFGIAAFNQKCRESVWEYQDEWEKITDRIGFWLDIKNAYITYENAYIETVWNILKRIWEKKLLYKGHKIVPWCTRCGTALSSHEVAQGYKEVEDVSVYVKFKVKKGQKFGGFVADDKTYILAWTTTPWTLPGNVALAVGKDIEYTICRKYVAHDNSGKAIYENLILAKEIYERNELRSDGPLWQEIGMKLEPTPEKGEYPLFEVIPVKGADLVGVTYEPLFDVKPLQTREAYRVYAADFVSTEEGTGVVHTAVMYGEDDYQLGREVGLPQYHTVNEQGKFTADVPHLAGLYVKAKETEERIIDHLKDKNYFFKAEPHTHEYPFCWRCGSPLLYYARDSWFIAMSKLRDELRTRNASVRWVPDTIKEGRFGEWLREAKDWAISRERYWGTPLPLWQCDTCKETTAFGSVAELAATQPVGTNRYFIARHGEAESNLKNVSNCFPEPQQFHLTLKGRKQVETLARSLRGKNIDLIIASDLTRTKESAQFIGENLGTKTIRFDKRLREVNVGDFNGRPSAEYHRFFSSPFEKFMKQPPNGETLRELRARLFSLLRECEESYKGKTILFITHEYPLWMLGSIFRGWSDRESLRVHEERAGDFLKTGEAEDMGVFHTLPRDETGMFDVHRPYIDSVSFACPRRGCSGTMRRTPEVTDVWFDSGAMPFAEEHWPFPPAGGRIGRSARSVSHTEKNAPPANYPADYISEAVDQTRGWFYTLLAIATLLGFKAPFKNVISLGHILDKNGQKMSKSKGNVVDPWEMIRKYGADAVRWHFYTMSPPGEPKNFDERDLERVVRQFFLLLYNSFVFYETYALKEGGTPKSTPASRNVLDCWIQARLRELVQSVTQNLEYYDIHGATRSIERFVVDDLSRWYIRRSRRRFQQPESARDHRDASQTLRFALLTVSKLLAPFAPFFAEGLFASLGTKIKKEQDSVHLADWPSLGRPSATDRKLIASMETVRRIAALALAKRAEAGIKVRQPLLELRIANTELRNQKELLAILCDEVNVKRTLCDRKLREEPLLDTAITHELQEEGMERELIRSIQGLRQDAGLKPQETIDLFIETAGELAHVVRSREAAILKMVRAARIAYSRPKQFDAELETRCYDEKVWIGLKRR